MNTPLRCFAIALLTLSLLPGVLSRAQAADVSFGGFGTYLDPKDYDESWGGGLRLKYDLVEYIAFDLRASMVRVRPFDANMFPLEANLLLQVPIGKTLLPYGGMGVGYYLFDSGNPKLQHSLGYGPLAGLELRLGRSIAIFGEARWLFLEPDVKGSSTLTKASLDSFGVNAGIMFLF
jgi:opacity protein-like surface antigen